ncbi:uncharacterized protein LOC121649825 [Melanotaenia boesemani]|uniref:uncharacterized protein LOC121649825 n=1 Tax=Melanotaenia boesemani TaxID=1250792 RepID=UPI001C05745E|nr:uncharacterized protein LOC121649825 [Melanotaenia boesemani]
MAFSSSSICFVFTVYQVFIFHLSHGFEVIQPETVSLDQLAIISCQHTSDGKVKDVQLKRDSGTLCQRGQKTCRNISMYEENPKKYVFILFNIAPKEMSLTYVCEFSVEENGVDYQEEGRGTKLLQGQKQKEKECPLPPSLPPHPPHPPVADQLMWILIGLLGFMFLYSFVITCCFIRLMISRKVCEDPTYVEMRKAPLAHGLDGYCA